MYVYRHATRHFTRERSEQVTHLQFKFTEHFSCIIMKIHCHCLHPSVICVSRIVYVTFVNLQKHHDAYHAALCCACKGIFDLGYHLSFVFPGGEVLNRVFIRKDSAPRLNLLPFCIPVLTEKSPLSPTFYSQMKRFDIPSLELSVPLYCRKFLVF